MIASLYHYRSYIAASAIVDLRHRYAGTSIGFVWNVLQPLALILMLSLVFSRIMPVRQTGGASQGVSFLLYLCAGYLPWIGFSDGLARCLNALPENAAYLKKLPIPEQVFVAKGALAALISMAVSLLLLAGLLLVLGQFPGWTILLAVPAAILLIGLAFGLGLALGTVNVFFRDVAHLTNVLLQLWMWCTPVVYTIEVIPEPYRDLFWFNPVYPYVVALRDAALYGRVSEPAVWLAMLGWTGTACALGLTILARLRPELRDVL